MHGSFLSLVVSCPNYYKRKACYRNLKMRNFKENSRQN